MAKTELAAAPLSELDHRTRRRAVITSTIGAAPQTL
jgi:hypothetical protein